MTEKPLILVTNDDGISAPGIRALIKAAKKFGEVVVVAPDKPQSGMGHAITINATLRINKISIDGEIDEYSCSGTPVDCVKLAVTTILPRRPDLLVSGINHGSNSSISVIYSGTMSAAVEGALENIPSIGFSLLDHSIDADFDGATLVAEKVIKNALENRIPEHTCLNVNIPPIQYDELNGIKICRQAKAVWEEEFEERTDPYGKKYYWMAGQLNNPDKGEDTDEWALKNNYVSIVPVQFDMTAYQAIPELKKWNHELSN